VEWALDEIEDLDVQREVTTTHTHWIGIMRFGTLFRRGLP
jgi:hypothetical protein